MVDTPVEERLPRSSKAPTPTFTKTVVKRSRRRPAEVVSSRQSLSGAICMLGSLSLAAATGAGGGAGGAPARMATASVSASSRCRTLRIGSGHPKTG
jgi:hypothetical protein